jgi:hypothetical protein
LGRAIDDITPPEGVAAAEENWIGGIADLGDAEAGELVQAMPGYFDYRSAIEEGLQREFGDEVVMYRAFSDEAYKAWASGDYQRPAGWTVRREVAENWHKVAVNALAHRNLTVYEVRVPVSAVVMRGSRNEGELVVDMNAIEARAAIRKAARPPMGSTTRTPAAVTGRLDLTNPRAIAAAQRYSYDLVTDITTQTRAAIRRTIVAGQRGQLTVDQQADRIRRAIGLNEQQAVAVMNLDMGLREDGDLTEEQITARVARAVEDGLDYRAEMIARTESIRAAAAGQQELFYQAAENGMLGVDAQRAWVASPDACGLCLELDGVEVGLNEPWEADGEELMLPPAHPMCRCTIAITDPGSYAPGSETLDEE